jgi:transposase-like protein
LQGGGKDSLTKTISTLMNVAMKIEQEKALQASPYERNEERTGQRNGYKDKTLKTRCYPAPQLTRVGNGTDPPPRQAN